MPCVSSFIKLNENEFALPVPNSYIPNCAQKLCPYYNINDYYFLFPFQRLCCYVYLHVTCSLHAHRNSHRSTLKAQKIQSAIWYSFLCFNRWIKKNTFKSHYKHINDVFFFISFANILDFKLVPKWVVLCVSTGSSARAWNFCILSTVCTELVIRINN